MVTNNERYFPTWLETAEAGNYVCTVGSLPQVSQLCLHSHTTKPWQAFRVKLSMLIYLESSSTSADSSWDKCVHISPLQQPC